jgi:transketolase
MTYEEYLKQLVAEDDRFMVMTAENRASLRNIPTQIGERFVDVGIAEMTLVGSAAGMALRGRIPVVHALAAFLSMRSFEHIRTDVGYPSLPVKLVGSFAGFLSQANGPTHQAIEDMGLMAGIPNVGVFAPADFDDMMAGLPQVLTSDKPFYIRYNDSPAQVKHSNEFEIGRAETIRGGEEVLLLSIGMLLSEADKAAAILADNGIDAGLVNLRTLDPIDEDMIIEKSRKARLVVTIEDHFAAGGLYSALSRIFTASRINTQALPVGLTDWYKPAPLGDVLKYEGFTGEQIAEKIQNELEK